MSKAPSGNVKEYEGDGEWFKIWEKKICNDNGDLTKDAWCTYNHPSFDFQIPKDTPPGEYLVRAEHVGLHGAQVNEAEFYYSCAQIKVTGNGSGAPSKTYKIPGLYNDQMTLFNGLNLWVDKAATINKDMDQTPVGDEPWTGGGSAKQASYSSDSTPSSASSTNTNSQGADASNGNSGNPWNQQAQNDASATQHTDANCGGRMNSAQ